MNKALISLMMVLLFVMVSCGGDDSSEKSGLGESCTKTSDCEGDLKCIDLVCVSDSGDTGDTGDTGDPVPTCPESEKFCYEHDGLNWSDASDDWMVLDDAVEYCENLGGRLPTISELRTLIQNCPATETGGGCGITDDCLSSENCWTDQCDGCGYGEFAIYSVFGNEGLLWSSSKLSDYDTYWFIDFPCGSVDISGKNNDNINVRCVR